MWALGRAVDALEEDVGAMVWEALTHSPESTEAMRLANYYAEGNRIRAERDVVKLVEGINEDANALRTILDNIQEHAKLARVSKGCAWSRVAPYAVGAAFSGNEGLLHFAADVLGLLDYGPCASHLRKGVSVLQPREGGYAFYDPDYEDVVEVSDSE